jgi:hypothetical protein
MPELWPAYANCEASEWNLLGRDERTRQRDEIFDSVRGKGKGVVPEGWIEAAAEGERRSKYHWRVLTSDEQKREKAILKELKNPPLRNGGSSSSSSGGRSVGTEGVNVINVLQSGSRVASLSNDPPLRTKRKFAQSEFDTRIVGLMQKVERLNRDMESQRRHGDPSQSLMLIYRNQRAQANPKGGATPRNKRWREQEKIVVMAPDELVVHTVTGAVYKELEGRASVDNIYSEERKRFEVSLVHQSAEVEAIVKPHLVVEAASAQAVKRVEDEEDTTITTSVSVHHPMGQVVDVDGDDETMVSIAPVPSASRFNN